MVPTTTRDRLRGAGSAAPPGRGRSPSGCAVARLGSQRLGRGWRVEFDLPGLGEPSIAAGGWTAAAHAHLVREGVAALGWESLSLSGRS